MTTKAVAWQYNRRGPLPSTLEKKEIQLPSLKVGESLVKIHAAALNPVDWKVASISPPLLKKLPHTAGADFSGEIIEVVHPSTSTIGMDADPPWLQEGAKVYGILSVDVTMRSGQGTLATYAIVKNSDLGEIPKDMNMEDAAGITLVGLTAAVLASKVKSKDRILVLGGTKQNDGIPQLQEKYSSEPFDLILDCVGSFKVYNACPAFLKKEGAYINIGASSLDLSNFRASVVSLVKNLLPTLFRPAMLGGVPRKYSTTGLDKKFMKQLREYIDSGKVKPLTDKVFQFDEAPKAYEYLIGGRATGKVVVKVTDSK